jgi:Mor family transcriptional regulator
MHAHSTIAGLSDLKSGSAIHASQRRAGDFERNESMKVVRTGLRTAYGISTTAVLRVVRKCNRQSQTNKTLGDGQPASQRDTASNN